VGAKYFLLVATFLRTKQITQQKPMTPIVHGAFFFQKKEMQELYAIEQAKTLTLAPHSLYLKGRHIKCEIALCKKKDTRDKREDIKKDISRRELRGRD
jgi:tmRNA-binding protein